MGERGFKCPWCGKINEIDFPEGKFFLPPFRMICVKCFNVYKLSDEDIQKESMECEW
jgi:hypothetical protein